VLRHTARNVRPFWVAVLLTATLFLAAPVLGGTYNKVLSVGDKTPTWSALPGVDGKKYSSDDFKGHDVVVVVFTCCSCPAAEDYEDRILALSKKLAALKGKAALVAVNVNTIEEDRLPAMQERAKAKKFDFPYLYDETQKIARDFGAQYTPEFFVLNKERKVVYMGALDDEDHIEKVKARFVEDAITAALDGKAPAVGETLGRGCRIRYNRVKKPK
jgi:peroxiredoxin